MSPAKQPSSSHPLIDALHQEEATHRLLDLSLEHLLDLPIESWLDIEVFYESIQTVYQPQVAKQLLLEWLPRLIESSSDLSELGGRPLSGWLTPDLDAELRSLAARAKLLTASRIQEFVTHPLTHHITQAFVEETLQRFIQRVKPSGEGGGLLGVASRGALGWASKASRGALSGIGEQLQGHLGSLTKDFVNASMSVLLEQLGQIIGTKEVAQRLAEAQLSLYDEFRGTPPSQLFQKYGIWLNKAEDETSVHTAVQEWAELISDWISSLLELPELESLAGKVHQDLITALSQRTPRDIINDNDTIENIKAQISTSLRPIITNIASSDSFAKWCDDYL